MCVQTLVLVNTIVVLLFRCHRPCSDRTETKLRELRNFQRHLVRKIGGVHIIHGFKKIAG